LLLIWLPYCCSYHLAQNIPKIILIIKEWRKLIKYNNLIIRKLKVNKILLKLIEKYVFKSTFWLEKLMKLICNKLGNEDQHMF